MSTPDISNSADIIDSRDIIARLDELREEREDLVKASEEASQEGGEAETDARDALNEWDEEYGAELTALAALAEEAEGYAEDWRHGTTLIRDSYFEEHAREFADDIGAIDRNANWPLSCIDWSKAARELQMDYTSVEFDGVTYWVR